MLQTPPKLAHELIYPLVELVEVVCSSSRKIIATLHAGDKHLISGLL